MATPAHCAYCFESLSASLEKRRPLPLDQVEALWEKYEASDDESDPAEEPDDQMRVDGSAHPRSSSSDENAQPPAYKPAPISRLLASSPASHSASASSSSIPSATSSTPSLNTATSSSATSKSSSRTSFFSSLPRRLGGGRRKAARSSASDEEEYPLFVTWNTISRSGSRSLRGCIGTFEAQELDDGLRSYALTSAFEDSRFIPITARELSALECGVTLLTDFEPISNPLSWDIGKHGLRISFIWQNRRYGATYLPDVAREQGWTKEETMVSLMRKAGWSGRREEWRTVKDLSVVRYQGRRATLEYRSWREWRDWVEQTGRGEKMDY